jgi:hypothetical protein
MIDISSEFLLITVVNNEQGSPDHGAQGKDRFDE